MFIVEVKLNYPLCQQFLCLIRDSVGGSLGISKMLGNNALMELSSTESH